MENGANRDGLKLYRGEPRGDSEMTPRSRNPFRLGVPGVAFLLVGIIVVISSLIGLNCGTVIFLSISKVNFKVRVWGRCLRTI